jgi:hypothetical protein
VIADVILEQLSHQAVDCPSRCGEPLKNIGTRCVLFQGTLDGFELTNDLFCPVQEIELFAG